MITIFNTPNNLIQKIYFGKEIKSTIFKMASILFIVLANFNTLSAQSSYLICANNIMLAHAQPKPKSISVGTTCKVYTVFLVKTFPLIESNTDYMSSMETDESTNYDLFYGKSADEDLHSHINNKETSKIKELSKIQKIKIAQKINS